MTDNNTSNTRSKLTLKLPSSASSSDLGKKNHDKEKKQNSSAVHVTIKGRKKEHNNNDYNSTGLNKNELEARFKAISSSKNNQFDNHKTHDVFNKIRDSNMESTKDHRKENTVKTNEISSKNLSIKEELNSHDHSNFSKTIDEKPKSVESSIHDNHEQKSTNFAPKNFNL